MAILSADLVWTVLAATLFAGVCWWNVRWAVVLVMALGCVTAIPFLRLSGERVDERLRLAQILVTVLAAAWLIQRRTRVARGWRWSAVDVPLAALIAVSVVSLVTGFGSIDPALDPAHVKRSVAIGQIVLFVWPMALYVVVADTMGDPRWITRLLAVVVVMSLPALALPVLGVPAEVALAFSVPFAMIASPLALSRLFDGASPLVALGLVVLVVNPIAAGLAVGKALWYIGGTVSLLVVAALRVRGVVLGVLLALAAGAWIGSFAITRDPLPPPLRSIVDREIAQQSLGGRGGRERLAMDAIRLWRGHPLFGVGPGNMWPYMHRYSTLDTSHNQYTNILLELGVAGLACLLAFIVAAYVTGARALRRARTALERDVVVAWLGLFTGLVAGGITGDVLLQSIRNAGLATFGWYYQAWMLLGLVVAISGFSRWRHREHVADGQAA